MKVGTVTVTEIVAGDRILSSGFAWPVGTPGEYSVAAVETLDTGEIRFTGRKWADGYSFPIPGLSVRVAPDTPVYIFERNTR
jgi:hypothetical protein